MSTMVLRILLLILLLINYNYSFDFYEQFESSDDSSTDLRNSISRSSIKRRVRFPVNRALPHLLVLSSHPVISVRLPVINLTNFMKQEVPGRLEPILLASSLKTEH